MNDRITEKREALSGCVTRLRQLRDSAQSERDRLQADYPAQLVAFASGAVSGSELTAYRQRLTELDEILKAPFEKALAMLDDSLRGVADQMRAENGADAARQRRKEYFTYRDGLIQKGEYTPHDERQLTLLASAANQDCALEVKRLLPEIYSYQHQHTPAQRAEKQFTPSFELIQEGE